MRLQKTAPLREDVALSGEDFGEDIGRGGGRGRGGRGGGRGRGRGPRGRGGRGGGRRGGRGRGRPPHPREREDDLPDLEEEDELAGRKERRARRKLRRKQRGERKSLRSKQRGVKRHRRAKTSRSGRSKGNRGGRSGGRPGRTPSRGGAANRSRMPGVVQDAAEQLDTLPVDEEWTSPEDDGAEWDDGGEWDDGEEWDEDDGEEWDEDFDEFEEEYLDGTYAELGAAVDVGRISRSDARRIFSNVKQRIAEKRAQVQANVAQRRRQRSGPAAPAAQPDGWGPVARLNSNIRIQAINGHQAAVMQLRSGLWIVADVKAQATLPTTQGGIAGVLPMLMARGAAKAIQRVVQNRRQNGGGTRLWQRNQRNNPVLNPPSQPHLAPSSPPLLLAGPTAPTRIDLGACCDWADPEDL